MAADTDITTLAYVKNYLGIVADDTSMDDVLQQLITSASQFAASYCSRNFVSTTMTKLYSGQDSDCLVLGESPISSVDSVAVDGVVVQPSASVQQPGFVFDDTALYVRGGVAVFTRGVKNIEVTFTAGYAKPTDTAVAPIQAMPFDLQQAIAELVGLKMKRRDNLDVASRGIAGESISYVITDMPKPVKTVFQSYQKAWPFNPW